MSQNILRLPDVLKRLSISRSSIYAKLKIKEFPEPIRLGKRSIGWLEDDIHDWIAQQVEASRPKRV